VGFAFLKGSSAAHLEPERGLPKNGPGMRRSFSNAHLRDLGLIVAIVMLLAGVPSTAGFVVVSGPSHPELTVNICQPIQTFDRVSNTLLARPASVMPEFVLRHLSSTALN